jgi:hypothetical protein
MLRYPSAGDSISGSITLSNSNPSSSRLSFASCPLSTQNINRRLKLIQRTGLFINGIVSERFGYRKTMIVSLVAVAGFIFIPFFAKNLTDLEIGEILCK